MNKKPKILLFDIETVPNLAYIWGKFDQTAIAFEKEWELLCFSYKWLKRKKIYFKKKVGSDDKSLCKNLWELLNEADLVIAHNANGFDIKKINARLAFYRYPPPAPYAVVDTLRVAKRYFKFTSNRLTDLGKHFGFGSKVETGGFQLWLDCISGKKRAWRKMEKYNKQDIILLEKVYLELRPWIKDHPNLSLLLGDRKCPNCGSSKVAKKGTRATHRTLQQQFKCNECLSWFSQPIGKRLPAYGQV